MVANWLLNVIHDVASCPSKAECERRGARVGVARRLLLRLANALVCLEMHMLGLSTEFSKTQNTYPLNRSALPTR